MKSLSELTFVLLTAAACIAGTLILVHLINAYHYGVM